MRWFNVERATTIFLLAGVGFFLLAFAGLGLAPWAQVDRTVSEQAPKSLTPLTAEQIRGRKLYMQNGCDYCHTQFVRRVGNDPLRYGPPSDAWEYSRQYPHLFGTRRIGPDLTREGGVHSDDWQYAHLYNPRLVVSWSVMPDFPWLFDGSPAKPSPQAKALVAYLQTLGRPRRSALLADGGAKERFIPGIGKVLEYPYGGRGLADPGYDKVIYFEKAKRPIDTAALRARGEHLYRANCTGCHGKEGLGDGPAAQYLTPTPVRLSAFRFNRDFLYKLLYYGRPGSAMPSWVHAFDSFLSPKELWALDYYLTGPGFFQGDARLSAQQAPQPPPKSDALLKLGHTTFATTCFVCHGTHGGGDGPAAASLSPAPVDFQGMQPSVRWTFHIITDGRHGTGMASYASLPERTRWGLAYYVESLFKGTETAAGKQAAAAQPTPAGS